MLTIRMTNKGVLSPVEVGLSSTNRTVAHFCRHYVLLDLKGFINQTLYTHIGNWASEFLKDDKNHLPIIP